MRPVTQRRLLHCMILMVAIALGLLSFELKAGGIRSLLVPAFRGDARIEYPSRLDLGDVEVSRVIRTRLTVRNIGGADLVIDDIKSSCACTGLWREDAGNWVAVQSIAIPPG